MPPFVNPEVIPTGGAIALTFATASGQVSISRATSGVSGLSAWTVLSSGAASGPLGPLGVNGYYLDAGDQLPGPLSAAAQWVYEITDSTGTTQTQAITPVAAITIEPDPILAIVMRLLQAGLQNIAPPAGILMPRIMLAMPLDNAPALPLIVIAPEQDAMMEQPIGVDVPKPDSQNVWQIMDLQKHVLRVSILSLNAVERDYYKNAVISIFKVLLGAVLGPLGQDVRHGYMAASYQQTKEHIDQVPGFYGCDVMLEITGQFNVVVTTTYGIIAEITLQGSEEGTVVIDAQVPTS